MYLLINIGNDIKREGDERRNFESKVEDIIFLIYKKYIYIVKKLYRNFLEDEELRKCRRSKSKFEFLKDFIKFRKKCNDTINK